MKEKLKLFILTLVTVMLCAIGVNAEMYFGDINITSSYGGVSDYYYLGEEFAVTAQLYPNEEDTSAADILIALYDTDGVLISVEIADTTQQIDYVEANAKFTLSDKKEIFAKCYAWENGKMLPVASKYGYYINGKEKVGDVCIPYNTVEEISTETITAYTENPNSVTEYSLSSDCEIYVNGIACTNGMNILNSYYLGEYVYPTLGDIILTDSDGDDIYDRIDAEIGFSAVADEVFDNEIYFERAFSNEIGYSIDTSVAEECRIILNGEEISISDIKEYDVMTIYYDMNGDIESSSFYNIYVSRKKVSGMVTAISDESISVDDVKYMISPVTSVDAELAYNFDFYMDIYNKVVYSDELPTPAQLAIVEDAYTGNDSAHYVKIIKPDGADEEYRIRNESDFEIYYYYVYQSDGTKLPVQDRVYEYSVNGATGCIVLKEQFIAKGGEGLQYDEVTSIISTMALSAETTSILDCSEYADKGIVCSISIKNLVDKATYTAYGFDKLVDDTYSFVIITGGGSASEGTDEVITNETEFVIYSKSYPTEVDGEDKTAYLVYKNNGAEAVEIILDDDSVAISDIVEGTPLVINKNASGYVTTIYPLFQPTALGDYNVFASAVRANMVDGTWDDILNIENLDATLKGSSGDWVFGAVYDRYSGSGGSTITIASTKDTYQTVTVDDLTYSAVTNVDYLTEYDVDSEAGFIKYSYVLRANRGLRVSNSVLSEVVRLSSMSVAHVDNDVLFAFDHRVITNSEDASKGKIDFILAKTVDGDITEAYIIAPSR